MRPTLVHDMEPVRVAMMYAIADGAGVVGDCRVISDQRELFGLTASALTARLTPKQIASAGRELADRLSGR